MISWFNLTLLSVAFLVSFFFLSKKLLNDEADIDPRLYGGSMQLVAGIVSFMVAVATGLHFELTGVSSIFLILMMACYSIGPSLYYDGFKHVELSESMILGSSGVIWSLVFGALFLGESFVWTKGVGVMLVFIAIILISLNNKISFQSFSKYKLFLLIAPIFYVLGATLDNKLMTFSNAATYLSMSFLLGGSAFLLVNIRRVSKTGKKTFGNSKFWKIVVINGLFVCLAYLCVFKAYELGGEVSRMFPIQQLESVLVPLLGIVLLKERDRIPMKLVSAIIAFAGIYLIKS